jgi:hypothetical protein
MRKKKKMKRGNFTKHISCKPLQGSKEGEGEEEVRVTRFGLSIAMIAL